VEELAECRNKLLQFANHFQSLPELTLLNNVWQKAKQLEGSFSGSWMGYHSRVYYRNFEAPPAGTHFDIQHGTAGTYYSSPDHNWVEHTAQDVIDMIADEEAKAAIKTVEQHAEKGLEVFKSVEADVSSILHVYLSEHNDTFVSRLADEIGEIKILSSAQIANDLCPKRQVITSDYKAAQQGTWVPPHIQVQTRITAAHQPAAHCHQQAEKLEKLTAHLSRIRKKEIMAARIGTNVFIGHGRSHAWRDLKDFVKDRLRLPYDEFNRVPVAGITNIGRLEAMLDAASCAFIIMTAEDEQEGGKLHARMNVIHEVGLFQGRLGFNKAIVLLEEGCEEFSNIQGLGQIRFPKGNIAAKFEDIRQVLEREGILDVTD
jgi:predicted nucleotide-binding protein